MLMIIIAIVAVAVFVYIRMDARTEMIPNNVTDNKTSSSLQSDEKDVTVDWKIYRNDKYGFEVKYPQNWAIETRESNSKVGAGHHIKFVNRENNYALFMNVYSRDTLDNNNYMRSEEKEGASLTLHEDILGGDYVRIIEADNIVRGRLPIEDNEYGSISFGLRKIKFAGVENSIATIDMVVFRNDKFGYIIGYGIEEDSAKSWDKVTVEKMDNIVRSFKFTK